MAARKYLTALVALMTFILMWQNASSAEKVRFASHFKETVFYVLPVLAALERGFWKAEGLEPVWLPFDSATTMVQAVAAGEVDMGTHGMDSAIIAASRGVPEIIVADPKMNNEFVIWVLTDSPFKEAKDLRGSRIGITRFGGTPHRMTQIAVKTLGIEKDVRFVATGGGGPAVAAFRARSVDSLALDIFGIIHLQAKGEARVLAHLNQFAPEGAAAQVVYSTRGFLAKNPEAVRKAIKGFIQGAEFLMKNRDWSIEKIKKEWGYTEEAARAVFPMLKYGAEGKIIKKKIENALNFVVEYGLVPKDKAPPLDTLYAKEFAD